MKCIGFGVTEGKCNNKAGTQWSDYWCEECDKVRRDTVRKQLEAIQKHEAKMTGEDECEQLTKQCPDCGGKVRYYHASHEFGDRLSRIVCAKKCQGWKVIAERSFGGQWIDVQLKTKNCTHYACYCIQERLDRIEAVWQKYKHLDKVLSDYRLVDDLNIRSAIRYDLWQAIRRS